MTPQERKDVVQQLVNDELARYGMDPVEITWDDEMPELLYGSWSEAGIENVGNRWDFWNPRLALNPAYLDDPYIMDTVVHEVRHAAQHELIRQTDRTLWDQIAGDDKADEYRRIREDYGVTKEEIDAWREDFADYQPWPEPLADDASPEERAEYEAAFQRYWDQAVEVDARSTAGAYTNTMEFSDLQELQRRAGVRVSEEP